MKYAANLSLLWPELPYLDRFDAAAEAGFAGVEVLFPYEVPAKETRRALLRGGLEMVLINAPPPNYADGPRGFAATPGGSDRFRHDFKRSLRYVEALRVQYLHVMAGPGEGEAAKAQMIENLKWAAGEAPKGLVLTIEPLCPQSMQGYFLNDYALAAQILDAVDAPNLALQFDSFHAQMIHGDAVRCWQEYQGRVAHVQLGDAPDRSAPGTGDVDFAALFDAIKASGYNGWLSGEYHPIQPTGETLDWMQRP